MGIVKLVERTAWTDGRLDDLATRVDAGFAQVDRRFAQVDRRFEQVDRDIRDLRLEMVQRFDRLEATVIRFGGGLLLALFMSVLLRGL